MVWCMPHGQDDKTSYREYGVVVNAHGNSCDKQATSEYGLVYVNGTVMTDKLEREYGVGYLNGTVIQTKLLEVWCGVTQVAQ